MVTAAWLHCGTQHDLNANPLPTYASWHFICESTCAPFTYAAVHDAAGGVTRRRVTGVTRRDGDDVTGRHSKETRLGRNGGRGTKPQAVQRRVAMKGINANKETHDEKDGALKNVCGVPWYLSSGALPLKAWVPSRGLGGPSYILRVIRPLGMSVNLPGRDRPRTHKEGREMRYLRDHMLFGAIITRV